MRNVFFSSVLLFASAAGAQSDSTLDPVTVTATMGPARVSQSGRNMLVIPGSALQQLPVHSIDELLRYVPGVEVQSRGPMGTQSDIVMRGGTFQQVLVLLDGMRLNDPITGHFNSYIPVAAEEIDRIEVLKGPAAALYGSDAVGGVIHVITKTFRKTYIQQKTTAGARYTRGEHKLRNDQAGFYHQENGWAFSGGVQSNEADGVQQRGITSYFRNRTASLSLSRQLTQKLRVALRSSLDDRNFAAQNFYTTFLSDTAFERVRTSWNQAGLQYQSGKATLALDLGYKATDDEYAFNKVAIANRNKSSLFQSLLRYNHILSRKTTLNSGLQWVQRGIRSNDRGNHNEAQLTGFTQVQVALTEKLTVLPALRLDWQEQRGLEVVPGFSAGYTLNKFVFRGSVGNTIRDADFTERYNNYNKPRVTSGRIGNPDLEAEHAFAYEAGIDYAPANRFKSSFSFFQRFHKGLIDYAPTAYADMPRKTNLVDPGTYALAKNLSEVTITGAELDLQYAQPLPGKAGDLYGNLGLVRAEAYSKEGASAFYLSSFAKLLVNFGVRYAHPRFTLALTGLYKERKRQSVTSIQAKLSSDYFVMNGRAELNLLQNKAAIFIQADNIFDVSYSDLLGAQMPGQWLMGGVRIKL